MTDAAHTTDGAGTAGGTDPAHPPVPPHPAGAAVPGGQTGTGHPPIPPHPADAAAPGHGAGFDRAGFDDAPPPAGPGHPTGPGHSTGPGHPTGPAEGHRGQAAPTGHVGPADTAAMPAVPPAGPGAATGPAGAQPAAPPPYTPDPASGPAPYGGGPHGDSPQPPYDGDDDRPRPKRKRRGRGLLITLVVLGGLFVGADRLAVNWVESKAADELKTREGLTITPEVSIKGFPFLTQALSKELDEVEINLDGLVTETGDRQVRVTELRAVLHQVRISGDLSSATADSASGRAHISYADLSAAAGPGIKVSHAGKTAEGKSQVKITGTFMGLSMSANGTVSVVDGNTIRLRVNAIPENIPGKWEQQIRSRTDFDRKVDGMPSGMRLDGVESTPDGVDIAVVGSQVDLTS